MKKAFFGLFSIFMVTILFFSFTSQSVQADQQQNFDTPTPTATTFQNEGIADGDWSSGKEVSIDLSKTKAPKSYLQLLGEGVKALFFGKICHPFHGGQYGWTGSIYQLVDGKWIKAHTYFIWYPDSEGSFMACTNASFGGIYALFGSYNENVNPTATIFITATATQTPTTTPKPTSKPTSTPITDIVGEVIR
jgi:hypothetical protein